MSGLFYKHFQSISPMMQMDFFVGQCGVGVDDFRLFCLLFVPLRNNMTAYLEVVKIF